MGWFNMFRLWQPQSEEYMFLWNWVVAKHTLQQLAPTMAEKVREHYAAIVAMNNADPNSDVSFGHFADFDYYWISVTLAHMGIAPMLGSKGAKWFYVQNHRRARWRAGEQGESMGPQVLKDILDEYEVRIEME